MESWTRDPDNHAVRTRSPRPATARAIVLATTLVCIGALSGCAVPAANPIPLNIQLPPPGDLQLVETHADPKAHTGATVRWGGNVIQVNHDSAGNALIQVIERRLDAQGRPIEGSVSDGRFVISATPNVDPQLYARDQLLTVAGTISGGVTTLIGDETQTLPVVQVSEFMVWLPRWRYDPYRAPYWDPYWDPYWGPYWGPYHYGYGPRVRFGVGVGGYRRYRRRY